MELLQSNILIFAAAAAAVLVLVTWLICHSRIAVLKSRLRGADMKCADIQEASARREKELSTMYESSLNDLKEAHRRDLDQQLGLLREQLSNQTGELLKQREAGLNEANRLSMDAIIAPLKESIAGMEKAMQESRRSMEDNKEAHDKNTASLATELRKAIEDMQKQSSSIGSQAGELAAALRSKSKIQGIWGETLLDTLLEKEGLRKGRDYDKEETLRDADGTVLANADSGRRMRPDFIFHYPDGKDVVIDSKVSLKDYVEYVNASSDELRAASLLAHVDSVKRHVRELSVKDYSSYIKAPRTSLDYVLMFIPNDQAWRVAVEQEPMLWQDAFDKGVLVTTEQSIMPFLRMIRIAWTKVDQFHNQEEIITSARRMLDRVAEFYGYYQDIGRKLEAVQKAYNGAEGKLRDGGASISTSARQVVSLGVKPSAGKMLPEPDFSVMDGPVGE